MEENSSNPVIQMQLKGHQWVKEGLGEQGYRSNRLTGGRGFKVVTQAREDETALREEIVRGSQQ